MRSYKQFVEIYEKHGRYTLVLFIFINLLSIIGIFYLHINTDFLQFIPTNSKKFSEYENMVSIFESAEQIAFLSELERIPKTPEDLMFLRKIQDELKDVNGVAKVLGPIPGRVLAGFRLIDTSRIDEKTANLVFKFIENLKDMKNIYQKNGKTYALFTIMLKENASALRVAKKAERIVSRYFKKYYSTGDIYLESKIFDYILKIILILPPVAILILLNIFRFQLGSFKAAFLSILPAGIGALWTLGFIGWTAKEISVASVLAPIFTIVMGSADGLHLVSHIVDHLNEGMSKKEALIKSLERIGIPIILTTITTIAGFLSSLSISSTAMRQLMIFASVGITFAAIATWWILPMIALKVRLFTNLDEVKSKKTSVFEKFIGRRSYILTVILILVFFWGIFFLNTDFNMTSLYKPWTEVRKNLNTIQGITGSGIPIFIVYHFSKDPFSTELINKVFNVVDKLKEAYLSTKSVSAYDIVRIFYNMLYGVNDKFSKDTVKIHFVVKLLGSWKDSPIKQFISNKKNIGRFIVFPKDLKSKTLEEIEKYTVQTASNFSALGIPYAIKEMNERIVPEQLRSLFIAFIVMFIIMWLTLKSMRLSFLSLLPVGITMIILCGFMGYTRIPLSIITSTIANITIGVGIDYAIHYISLYKKLLNEGRDKKSAIMKALEYVAKPVTANAFGLAAGLSALLLSPLLIHTYVSLLMWVTMLSSSFLSLSLLPSILIRR